MIKLIIFLLSIQLANAQLKDTTILKNFDGPGRAISRKVSEKELGFLRLEAGDNIRIDSNGNSLRFSAILPPPVVVQPTTNTSTMVTTTNTDIEITEKSKGLILRDEKGKRYRIMIYKGQIVPVKL